MFGTTLIYTATVSGWLFVCLVVWYHERLQGDIYTKARLRELPALLLISTLMLPLVQDEDKDSNQIVAVMRFMYCWTYTEHPLFQRVSLSCSPRLLSRLWISSEVFAIFAFAFFGPTTSSKCQGDFAGIRWANRSAQYQHLASWKELVSPDKTSLFLPVFYQFITNL